jgi:hypothetical protein
MHTIKSQLKLLYCVQGILQVQQQEGLPGQEARRAVPQRPGYVDRHLRERPQPRAAAGPVSAR